VERIYQLRLPYQPMTVPGDVVFLTAGVDVQKYGFWYVVRGWAPQGRSYLITNGYVESWSAVLRVIVRDRYASTDGAAAFQVVRGMLDSSDGVRTDEIYRVAREYGDVLSAAKGQQSLVGYMVKTVTLRASKTEIGEGLPLTHVNTTWAKDRLAVAIANGTCFFHQAIDETYTRQLCSEHKIRVKSPTGERGVWQKKQGQRENHCLDCEVLALAAAEMSGLLSDLDEGPGGEFEAQAKTPPPPQKVRQDDDSDDWIRTPDNWLPGAGADDYDRNW
jgi:phage terminase large subunit GpA-like protein